MTLNTSIYNIPSVSTNIAASLSKLQTFTINFLNNILQLLFSTFYFKTLNTHVRHSYLTLDITGTKKVLSPPLNINVKGKDQLENTHKDPVFTENFTLELISAAIKPH